MPFNLGGPELIIILVIVLIVFGAGKLPNVMRDVGRGVNEFKKAQDDANAPGAPAAPPAPAASAPVTTTTYTSAAPVNGVAPAPPPPPAPRPNTEAAPRA